MLKFLSRVFKPKKSKNQGVKFRPTIDKMVIADLYFDDEKCQIDEKILPYEEYYRRKSHACSMEEATGWRNDPDYFSYKHKKDHQLIK